MNKHLFNTFSILSILGLTVLGFAAFSDKGNDSDLSKNSYSSQVDIVFDNEANKLEDTDFRNMDYMNLDFHNRELDKAVDYHDATKEDIFYMMLNTIFYYDKVSGTVMFQTDNPDVLYVDEFQCSLSDAQSYSCMSQRRIEDKNKIEVSSLSEPLYENIIYCNGIDRIDVFPMEKTYSAFNGGAVTLANVIRMPNENRLCIDDDGEHIFNMLTTPTNVFSASMCIQPQEITVGYLNNFDLWDVVDVITIDGRSYYIIHGEAEESYGARFGVSNFTFTVDTQTGVIVKFEGCDVDGNINQFMYTENLKFEDEASQVTLFNKNDYIDYLER
ncbi:hypothetical protein [Ruminococcus sp.]|uniref:hypothetical protein n=1 Tax=Ruminococcus sp. TaxID=41978 RepID=UPI001B5E8A60|nr:hypothetical protein [Ruminococcus sp.]MBP5431404.1 hypothetical protein [Ruminococcus sp.]